MSLSIALALIGLLVGGVVNGLADDLPLRVNPQRRQCHHCLIVLPWYKWLGLSRWQGCADCGHRATRRELIVELSMVFLWGVIPWLLPDAIWWQVLIVCFYTAVLLLIIVIDVEHRLILDVVTLPVTVIGLLLSFVAIDGENSFGLAVVGGVVSFLIFLLFYLIGNKLFGSGALGFGDVKMALMMGVMLGLHRVLFALVLAVVLGGIAGLVLLLWKRQGGMKSYFAYGPYLAVATWVMLIWGMKIYEWYVPS